MIAILIGLGVWQLERLHWKLDLIATVNAPYDGARRSSLDAALAMSADDAQYRTRRAGRPFRQCQGSLCLHHRRGWRCRSIMC